MKLMIFKGLVFVIALLALSGEALSSPRTVEWKLDDDTTKVLYIAPDLGTRLIFPFNLTDTQFTPSFSFTNTNKTFQTAPDLSKAANFKVLQNSFTVTVNRDAIVNLIDPNTGTMASPLLGYIFLSVGSYNLTIELRATTSIKQHIANVRFDIASIERDYLIAQTVTRKTQRLEEQYRQKVKDLDDQALNHALSMIGNLLVVEPEIEKVRSEFYLKTDKHHSLLVEIEDFLQYDKFTTLKIVIRNDSAEAISINQLKWFDVTEEQKKPITAYHQCEQRIEKYSTLVCALTTRQPDVSELDKMSFHFSTDQGEGEIKW